MQDISPSLGALNPSQTKHPVQDALNQFYDQLCRLVVENPANANFDLTINHEDINSKEFLSSLKHINQSLLSKLQTQRTETQVQLQSILTHLSSSVTNFPQPETFQHRLSVWQRNVTTDSLEGYAKTLIDIVNALHSVSSPQISSNASIQSSPAEHTILSEDIQNLQKLIKEVLSTLTTNHADQQMIEAGLAQTASTEAIVKSAITLLGLLIDDLTVEQRTHERFIESIDQLSISLDSAFRSFMENHKNYQTSVAQNSTEVKLQILNVESGIEDYADVKKIKSSANKALHKLQQQIANRERLDADHQISISVFQKRMDSLSQAFLTTLKSHKHSILKRRSLAASDTLTRLPTRDALAERIKHQLNLKDADGDRAIFMLIDLDKFKPINDEFGHIIGDKTLQVVSRALNHSMPKNGFLCRWGGDEFVVIQPVNKQTDAMNIASQLLNNIRSLPLKVQNHTIALTASIGVTEIRLNDDVTSLLERADKNLYRAKAQGGDLCMSDKGVMEVSS